MGIQESLSHSAQQFANRIAFVEKGRQINYTQFFELVKTIQVDLILAGVSAGQVVAVKDENSVSFAAALYAVMGLGAVALPVYHLAGKDEWDEMIQKAGVNIVLIHEKFGKDVSGTKILIDTKTFFLDHIKSESPNWHGIENPAFIRFTSGTTGMSKGVLLSEKSIWGRIDSANLVLQLNQDDVVVWVLPMAFHFVVSIMLYLKNGCKVVLCNSPFPSEIAKCMVDEQASFFYASPLHIKMLSQSSVELPPSLNWIISTSAGAQKFACEKFYQKFNKPVSQAYGIIEFGLPLIHSVDPTQMDSIGFITPGYEVGILDENGHLLPAGHEGKLAIRGVGQFEVYLFPWRKAEEISNSGWFFTGDIAIQHPDGRFFVRGREKSMVNLSGLKVFPEEVEEVILRLDQVAACKVYSVSDAREEEILEADVVLKSPISEDAIKQFCREKLALYKVPQKINRVDAIKETNSGKIKR